MAGYLTQRKESVTIIVIGSIVSTMLIRDRETIPASDGVEFCANNLDHKHRGLLYDAAKYASENIGGLGGTEGWGANEKMDWFNVERSERRCGKAMRAKITQKVIEAATLQNEVVFSQPGLKLLAAPWSYAFLIMLGRVSASYSTATPSENVFVRPDGTIVHPDGTTTKPDPNSLPPSKKELSPQESQDLSDAVSFLHEYITRHEAKSVSMRRIKGWGHDFHLVPEPWLLKKVEEEYLRMYKTEGIVASRLTS